MFEDFSFAVADKQSSWHSVATTTTTTTTDIGTVMPWTPDSLSSDEDNVSPFHSRPVSPLPSRRHEGISIDALAHHLSAHTLRPRSTTTTTTVVGIPTAPPYAYPYPEADNDHHHFQPTSMSPAHSHSTPQDTADRALLRTRRQANVRLQCDTAHLAAIAQLVEDMVSRGGSSATCRVSPPPSPSLSPGSESKSKSKAWSARRDAAIDEHEDEGYGDAETEEERRKARRRSSRLGTVGEPMRERCGVVKTASAAGGGMGPAMHTHTHGGGLRGVYGRAKDAARARRTRGKSLSVSARGVAISRS